MSAAGVFRSRAVQLLITLCLVGAAASVWIDSSGGAEALRAQLGWTAAGVLVPAHGIIAASPFPGEAVALLNGALFGFWSGALLNWLGWMLAAFLEYALVGRVASDLGFERARSRLPRRLRDLPVSHPAFQIVVRNLPLGGHFVNSASGAFRVPLWRYAWCAAIGLLPGAFAWSALGSGLVGA